MGKVIDLAEERTKRAASKAKEEAAEKARLISRILDRAAHLLIKDDKKDKDDE
jgi:hypothetical protein